MDTYKLQHLEKPRNHYNKDTLPLKSGLDFIIKTYNFNIYVYKFVFVETF